MNGTSVSFARVKRAVSLETVLLRYGLVAGLTQRGANLTGQCPFCDGHTSFRVSFEKNAWYCFACKQGGNVLDFVAKKEGVTIRQAALALNEWFGLGFGSAGSVSDPQPPQDDRACAGPTQGTPPAEPRDPTAPNPPLTFALKTLDFAHVSLAALGLSDEVVRGFGLGFCSKGIMKGRIAIPIRNLGGELLAYAGLSTDPEAEDRYLFPPKFQASLEIFNVGSIAGRPCTDLVYLSPEIAGVLRLVDARLAPALGLFDGTLSERQEAILSELLDEDSRLILVGDAFDPQTIVRLASFFAVRCLSFEALRKRALTSALID